MAIAKIRNKNERKKENGNTFILFNNKVVSDFTCSRVYLHLLQYLVNG